MKKTTGDGRFDDVLRALSRAPSVRPADIDLVGRTVGRFVVERRLGQGGMGVVYEASDPVLERKVALKVLRAGLRAGSTTRARLHEEARRIAALCHPHIATVYDVGEHEGIVFLAMERASGESLRARLAKPPALSFARSMRVLRAIASGLACAHEARIIHRDLKPENVVTGDDGTVKIVDFGIATSGSATEPDAAPSRPSSSGRGRPAGTRRYMAPEIAEGAAPSPRGDVYAFGVLAREVLSATAVGPRDRAARAALQRLVTACTSEEPARRPRDGGALLAEIDRIGAAPSGIGRPSVIAAGAAALATTLGVLAARSVPEGHASAPSASIRPARASVSARDEAPQGGRDSAGDGSSGSRARGKERGIEASAPADAPREASAQRAREGAPDHGVFADRPESATLDDIERIGGTVPVTTSVDRLGRLFAVVPIDGARPPGPAPAGSWMMPLAGAPGSTARAEVVADGDGGAVIHFTVRVKPGPARGAGSGGGGSHSFGPGTLSAQGVVVSSATGDDPFHIGEQIDGSGGPNPAHPALPQSRKNGPDGVVCTGEPPDSVYGSEGDDGTLYLFAHRGSGTDMLIAIITSDGVIAARGEGATSCDEEEFSDEG